MAVVFCFVVVDLPVRKVSLCKQFPALLNGWAPNQPGATRSVLCCWPRSSTTAANDLSDGTINAGLMSA